jgi:predicted ATPase
MPKVVITGGPGAGKTTLLAELAQRGLAVVPESARAVIAERRARGLPPRPAPEAFAREILRRDTLQHAAHAAAMRWVFFDRSAIEALGLLHEAAPMPPAELGQRLRAFDFWPVVMVLPPWEAIYTRDTERDSSFDHAVAVHARIVAWYGACGYAVHEVPQLTVGQRADHVLRVLGIAAPSLGPGG